MKILNALLLCPVFCYSSFYLIVCLLQGDVNSAWKHDMFDGVKKLGRGPLGGSGTTKLLVSNLDFGVSDSDIQVRC